MPDSPAPRDDRAAIPDKDRAPAGKPRRARAKGIGAYLRYSHLGVLFIAIFGGFVWLGMLADTHWHTGQWGVIAGALLGMAAASYALLKEMRRFADDC